MSVSHLVPALHTQLGPETVPVGSNADIETEIAQLGDLGLDGLRSRWRSEFGRAPPIHLSRYLLLRLLAYRLQAQLLGDLSPATRRLLDRLGRAKNVDANGAEVAVPLPNQGRLMPGAVLVREHEGQLHHIMVAEGGFVWNGETYPSLSKIAHAITGTKWSGPRFFGLQGKGMQS